jgi:sterol desaturase/sphingolipid hydroxylase (fatty acid hydroxylase superfamily)
MLFTSQKARGSEAGRREEGARAPRNARAVEYGLQPALLAGALLVWMPLRERPELYLFVLVAAQVVLGALEHLYPARTDWVQGPGEKLANVALVAGFTAFAGAVTLLYRGGLSEPLGELRAELGLDLWPGDWPLAARVMLAFLASELVWYGIHRSEHRFVWLWRVSGHAVHHSFKRLNAINFNANHPLEAFLILIPMTLITLLFGAGEEAGAASLLVVVNASVVHSNLKLNAKGIGWLFTTNAYHFRHHSKVFEESNTNYGCAAIVWDRLFGTFAQGTTHELGIGPSEPRLWEKLLLPIRQPRDVTVAP